jgi:hypothetical protein
MRRRKARFRPAASIVPPPTTHLLGADSAHPAPVGHQAGRTDLIRSALAGTPGLQALSGA